jgi:hypothetical protein
MTRVLMLSLLARQYLVVGPKIADQYPYSWLVWEPGAWTPPKKDDQLGDTRMPDSKPLSPQTGDALCFELRPPQTNVLHLGRAKENQLVINDMTVSREHLKLTAADGQWFVEPFPNVGVTKVGGATVGAGRRALLSSNAGLQVGGITLTFHDSRAFMMRLQAAAKALAPK